MNLWLCRCRMFGGADEAVRKLLDGTGLCQRDIEDPHLELPASALLTICDNVADMLGQDWFLNLPILWSTDAQSELGLAMRASPDFRVAIDVMSEFAHCRWPIIHLERRDDPRNIIISIGLLIAASQQNRQFAMCVACNCYSAGLGPSGFTNGQPDTLHGTR